MIVRVWGGGSVELLGEWVCVCLCVVVGGSVEQVEQVC